MPSVERAPCDSTTHIFSCVVCGRRAHGANYGVISCRACAKFFIRTQSLRKSYVCRTGEGECEVTKDIVCLCRRCRIDKCVAVGMRLPKTHGKRGRPKEKAYSPENSSPVANETSQDAILKRVGTAFSNCFEKRRILEGEYWATLHYEDIRVDAPNGEIFHLSNYEFSSDMFPQAVKLLRKMYNAALPEFSTLTSKAQDMTRISTAPSAYAFQSSYLTHKYFPYNDRYFFITTTSVFDNEGCGSYFPISDENSDKYALTRATKFYTDKTGSMMLPVLREANLTEIEYHAALCILFCSFDFAPWIDPKIVETGDAIKNKIYEELNYYYKNVLDCEDIATRLGRLMTCVYTAQEAGVLLQEEFQTYKLMGAYREDDMILKFFLS